MSRWHAVCLTAVVFVTANASGQEPEARNVPADRPVATFRGDPSGVTALAFSPDGRRLLSASVKDVRIWDPATGKEIQVVKAMGGNPMVFSPDGKSLAISERLDVTIRDAASGKELLRIEPHGEWDRNFPFRPSVGALAFSPDGGRLATAGSVTKVGGGHGYPGGVVRVWDGKTGKQLRQFGDLSTFAGAVAFSPDGKYLAAGTDGAGGELPEPGEVWIWDVSTGKVVHTFKTRKEVDPGENFSSAAAVAFSPDGKKVVAAVGGVRPARPVGRIPAGEEGAALRIWDVSTGRELLTLRGHTSWIGRTAFSPDGSQLASAGGDRVVRLWNTATGKEIKALSFDTTRITALAFSPDGRSLAAGSGTGQAPGEIKVWALTGE